MFKMDLSKFKKISQDATHTVLEHPHKHTIKIAHASLSPKLRAQLHALPTTVDEGPAHKLAEGGKIQHNPKLEESKKMADGGEVKQEAKKEETPVKQPTKEDQELVDTLHDPDLKRMVMKESMGMAKGGVAHYADGPDELVSKDDASKESFSEDSSQDQPQSPVTINIGQPSTAQTAPPQNPNVTGPLQVEPVDSTIPKAPDSVKPKEPLQVEPVGPSTIPTQPSEVTAPNFIPGYQQTVAGFGQQAQTEANLGKETARLETQRAADEGNTYLRAQKYAQDYDNEYKQVFKELQEGKIDPSHYWSDMTAPGKILTAIGLMGANLFGGSIGMPDAGTRVVDSLIQKNIEAQKADLGRKENLLSASMRHFNNMQHALEFQNDIGRAIAGSMMRAAGDKAQDPLAKAQFYQKAGQYAQTNAQRYGLMQAMQEAAQSGQTNVDQTLSYLRMLNPEAAKELESRYIPQIGVATVPLSTKTRDEIIARESLQQQVGALRRWAQEHSGSLNPSDMAYGKSLAASVQDAYRRANGQGVFREAEANFVKSIVASDPTAFFNSFRVDPKYKALEDSNLLELNNIKKSVGLPTKTREEMLTPQQRSFAGWARANPNDPRAALILKKLGLE